jgi:hypothetical protein
MLVRFLHDTEFTASVSGFDVKGVVVKVDARLDDDVEDSGYAQRLVMVEDLSFFFGGIECVRHA